MALCLSLCGEGRLQRGKRSVSWDCLQPKEEKTLESRAGRLSGTLPSGYAPTARPPPLFYSIYPPMPRSTPASPPPGARLLSIYCSGSRPELWRIPG